MLKAYKYRLYPTEKQQEHFVQAMGCVRYIYNKGLIVKTNYYAITGESLSAFDLITSLLKEEKKSNEWLKVPNAQSLHMPLINLDTAFTRFFKKQDKYPVFKKRSNRQSIQYPQKVWVDFKKNIVKIPKAGKVKIVFDRTFVGIIKTCTVSKTPTNKFFISILVEDDQELPAKLPIVPETTIGIDLGLKHFAILSDGTKIENPKFLKKSLQRLKVLQKRASKKQKGSNNRKKANLKVARLHEKIANQRLDFLHKTSTQIIRDNQTIIMEDLNVSGMVRNHKLAQAISDVSWSKFENMLKYKSEWYGNNFLQIGRFEPSSKTCSCCGYINAELSLKDREWTCSACHALLDRDVNAAINIKSFGLKSIIEKLVVSRQELPIELVEMPCSNEDRRSKKLLVLS